MKYGYDISARKIGISDELYAEMNRLANIFKSVIDEDPSDADVANWEKETFHLYQKITNEIGKYFEIEYLE